jgi:glutaredoxin
MKIIRFVLGRLILLLDFLFSPPTVKRSDSLQKKVDAAFQGMSIYQFETCPFCVKVRRFLRGASISLPLRDAKAEPFRGELLAGGGKLQVPCLKIEEQGRVRWLYESKDIIAFLQARVAEVHE